MKKYVLSVVWLLLVLLSLPPSGGAELLPPPTRQDLGLFDAVFNDFDEQDCRACHGASVSDLHHNLVNSEKLDCLTCHRVEVVNKSYQIIVTTNCLECHEQQPGAASVHHLTGTAQLGDCVACHGALVQNLDDGHYIPTYSATMVTPRPSAGTGAEGRGSCRFCHDWGNDAATGELVFSNMQTHHETGFGGQSDKCAWCHNTQAAQTLAIRACEQCHAPLSIHNIQADTNGDGVITPGGEAPYFGHIGSNEDCLGCHGGAVDPALLSSRNSAIDNPTRHHLLVASKGKKCLDCHKLLLNDDGLFVFKDFRVCSSCHAQGGRR